MSEPDRQPDQPVQPTEINPTGAERLYGIEREALEHAVTRATAQATQNVAQIHRRRLVVQSFLAAVIVSCAVGIAITLIANSNTLATARNYAAQVQRDRYNTILSSCQAQNDRNRTTIRRLTELRDQQLKTGASQVVTLLQAAGVHVTDPSGLAAVERGAINSNYEGSVRLINALAPARPSCTAYAAHQTTSVQTSKTHQTR